MRGPTSIPLRTVRITIDGTRQEDRATKCDDNGNRNGPGAIAIQKHPAMRSSGAPRVSQKFPAIHYSDHEIALLENV